MSWFDTATGAIGEWWDDNAENVGEMISGFVGSTGDAHSADPEADTVSTAHLSAGMSGSQPVVSVPVSQTQSNQLIDGVDNKIVYAGGGLVAFGLLLLVIKS